MADGQPHTLHTDFQNPPREFGMIPLWFWNDDLDEQELLRQVREFHAKGFGGFGPHPRNGLSHRVGYLTPEYFRLLRIVVDEAERLGMKVVLYDEGAYPSGSAQGRVVTENLEYGVHGLLPVQRTIQGPAKGYWRPHPGRALLDRLLFVVLGRELADGQLDPNSLQVIEPIEPELVPYDVPEGTWRLVSLWDVQSGAKIRGVFEEEEDYHTQAPAAGDVMNPDAVASFIRHTHEQNYAHLKEHFGKTILGIFTDEPVPLGRYDGEGRGFALRPYTAGFLDDLQQYWDEDVRRWLPAMWLDCGPRTEAFRIAYEHAIIDRIARVFFGMVGQWCADHNIAFSGHPGHSDEMVSVRYMQWPGQDIVGWYVAPTHLQRQEVAYSRWPGVDRVFFPTLEEPSALAGPHSVTAKVASSAALIDQRRRNGTEVLGNYGWRLTLDLTKWLLDWHLVRGTNLFFPHACYYSIRGRRAYESEPDLGVHNVWWPYFKIINDYMRRVCWLLTDGLPVCDVAVLTDEYFVAWAAAKELFQSQLDFAFIYAQPLLDARIEGDRLVIGHGRFRAVVCDPARVVTPEVRAKLDAFQAAGGVVVETWTTGTLASRLTAAMTPDLRVEGEAAPDLRVLHYRKVDWDYYFLVNEGETAIDRRISLAAVGALELWNPLDGSTRPWPARVVHGRLEIQLFLDRRQGLVLAVNPQLAPEANVAYPAVAGEIITTLDGPWTATDSQGQPVAIPCRGDWSREAGRELFTGTLTFTTTFELTAEQANTPLFLDLGQVGDIAEVHLNGLAVGVAPWAPYVLPLGAACRPGFNTLEVRVTNSMANAYEGVQLPSGLLGPVALRRATPFVPHAIFSMA